MTVPWGIHQKDLTQRIVDIFVELPGLLEEVATSDYTDLYSLKQMDKHIESVRSRLYSWRRDWELENPAAASEVPDNAIPIKEFTISHPLYRLYGNTLLRYRNFTQAMDICFYNCLLVWLWRVQKSVTGFAPAEEDDFGPTDLNQVREFSERRSKHPLLLPGEEQFFCQPVIEVIRSIKYFIDNAPRVKQQKMALIAPVGILFSALRPDGDLANWLEMMLSSARLPQTETAAIFK